MTHRSRLLESDLNAAARGVFDGLLGLFVEIVRMQAGRGGHSRRMRWAREQARPTRGRQEDVAARRTMESSIAWVGKWGRDLHVCAFALRAQEVMRAN